jgi:hypothetical protein
MIRGRHRAPRLSGPQRRLLTEMAMDAIDIQLSALEGQCPACDHSPGMLCRVHQRNVDQANAYRQLCGELGVTVA